MPQSEDRRRWLALAVIVTPQFVVVLDIAIVNVALPASVPNTVLEFAILVGLGVAAAGWGLLARRPKSSPQAA